VFLGSYAPEPLGDYVAGPNHVLPTGATARFASPLGVYDFVKRTSIIGGTARALRRLGPAVVKLAELEGLEAHARSGKVRLRSARARRRCMASKTKHKAVAKRGAKQASRPEVGH